MKSSYWKRINPWAYILGFIIFAAGIFAYGYRMERVIIYPYQVYCVPLMAASVILFVISHVAQRKAALLKIS
jgi:hypothetical protein